MKKRQYSDSDKATALAVLDANQGNVRKTARMTGVPHKTLDEWAKGRVNAECAEIRTEKRKDLAERLEELAHHCVDLLPDKLPGASVRDIAGALIVAVDKSQVLKGQPTSISKDVTERTNEERAARILELVRPAKTG